MGRRTALLGIWIGGFILGFVVYLVYPALSDFVLNVLPYFLKLDSTLIGAMLAGLASSFITVLAVAAWAYSSRRY